MTAVVAHRGLHVVERENTVAAFAAARALGVDGVELDVRRSADGALVVHHDAAIEGRSIGQVAAAELPAWVPTLDDALAACAGLRVNVEVKNIDDASEAQYDPSGAFARQVVARVRDLGWSPHVIVSCFDAATCRHVREADADLAVGWLLDWRLDTIASIGDAERWGLSAVHPYFRRLDAAGAGAAAAAGLEVNVWTVNAPTDLAAMIGLGVTSVITDDPAAALALARADGAPSPMT